MSLVRLLLGALGMRVVLLLLASSLLAFSLACSGEVTATDEDGSDPGTMSPDGGAGPPPGADWSLTVDMSPTERYVAGYPETHPVAGRAIASEGLDRVEVGDAPATVGGDGSFSAEVPVTEGLVTVPVVAHDAAGHSRKAHRSLLVADFQPEGWLNPQAAAVGVTDALLDEMAGPLLAEAGDIDIASEILARDVLSMDDRCTTHPTAASHDPAVIDLTLGDAGELLLVITVPALHIEFEGTCSSLLGTTNIDGSIDTDIVARTVLSAPAGEGCIDSLEHTPAEVTLPGFDMDVSGDGFTGLFVGLFADEDAAREEFAAEFAMSADVLLDEKLASVTLLDSSETLSLLDSDITLDLCLTGLGSDGGATRAIVGAAVTGTGASEAPGAPILRGDLPAGGADSLWLDSQLVAQMLFSAWQAGGLTSEEGIGDPVEYGLLTALVPALRGRHPNDTPVTVATVSELPPVVRAVVMDAPDAPDPDPDAGDEPPADEPPADEPPADEPPADDAPADEGAAAADLTIEIGDLMLELRAAGELLFRVNTILRITLDLVPTDDGALAPTVTGVEAEAHLIEEPVADADDEVLEEVVAMRIPAAAAGLLDGATLQLPDIGGALVAVDVTPHEGGRYVQIHLR